MIGSHRRWARLAAIGALSALVVATAERDAGAVKFRRPFDVAIGVNYGYDNNGGAAGCTDYGCGSVCYDTHSGTDFPLGIGTTVRAGAVGTVVATYNGCSDWGSYGNSCGGYCGNHVTINHADGTQTIYCHMKLNTIAVGVGQSVSCGQYLGQSASSGSSTGPHLHFGLRVGGVSRDPFAGSCSHAGSYWVSQGSYPHPMPSTQCETVCECSVGAVQTRPCCDCGTERRTCGSNCRWGGWSGCSGPDPGGGDQVCDTGDLGACAEGRRRCVAGCLTCEPLVGPSDETCDEVDNDCDGEVDEGSPETVGWPPPRWAARRVDASLPAWLGSDQPASGWVVFENVGTETWSAHQLMLALADAEQSQFHDPATWPAFDVLAVIDGEVGPGERVMIPFSLRLGGAESGPIAERFELLEPSGEPLRCPSPELTLEVDVTGTVSSPPADSKVIEGAPLAGGCATSPHGGPGLLIVLFGTLVLVGRRRRPTRTRRAR